VYDDLLGSDRAPVVGFDPGEDDAGNWPPPAKIRDPISGNFSIYERGAIRPATSDEASHLETASVWDYEHIVERLAKMTAAN
jgi:hypothetical protein